MSDDRTNALGYAEQYWWRVCDDGLIFQQGITGTRPPLSVATELTRVNQDRAKNGKHSIVLGEWDAIFVVDPPLSVPATRRAEKAVFCNKILSNYEVDVYKVGVPDPTNVMETIHEWEGIGDCEHFLHKCLEAGNFICKGNHTQELFDELAKRDNLLAPDAKILAEGVTRDQGQQLVDSGILKKGDIILYLNKNKTKAWEHRNRHAKNQPPPPYEHSAMYVGKTGGEDRGGITCHAVCRHHKHSDDNPWDDHWDLPHWDRYTFIHIKYPSEPFVEPCDSSLFDWWVFQEGHPMDIGKYFCIRPDGRAFATSHYGGHSAYWWQDRGRHSAYWFRIDNQIKFAWRKGGIGEVSSLPKNDEMDISFFQPSPPQAPVGSAPKLKVFPARRVKIKEDYDLVSPSRQLGHAAPKPHKNAGPLKHFEH